jgi:hypothetical protein
VAAIASLYRSAVRIRLSKTYWNLSLSFLGRKVAWRPCGETWGGVGFGPQSTYLVLHAFHRHSILSLIQVSTSEYEIKQTSRCSINSSNILYILMIKNRFTFESKVTNMVIFELMMSSSRFLFHGLCCALVFPSQGLLPVRQCVLPAQALVKISFS